MTFSPGTRDEELARLRELAARNPDGSGRVVLADPEGAEFRILRRDAGRAGG